jgi:hypothetical protein
MHHPKLFSLSLCVNSYSFFLTLFPSFFHIYLHSILSVFVSLFTFSLSLFLLSYFYLYFLHSFYIYIICLFFSSSFVNLSLFLGLLQCSLATQLLKYVVCILQDKIVITIFALLVGSRSLSATYNVESDLRNYHVNRPNHSIQRKVMKLDKATIKTSGFFAVDWILC